MGQILDVFRPRPVLQIPQIGDEVRCLEQFERGEVIEVERGGKHGDELELELKAGVATVERLGRVGLEGGRRRRGLDTREAGGFVHGSLMPRWLDVYESQSRLGEGLTPVKVTGALLHESCTTARGIQDRALKGRELRGAPTGAVKEVGTVIPT